MKQKLYTFFLALVALAISSLSITAQAQTVNTNRYITLTVKPDVDIKMNFAADVANTGVRIVSGTASQDYTVGTDWYGTMKFRSQTSTITIYGNIKKFACDDNYSGLTGLDVSKNTALTELACPGNYLSSLDVSKNTALKELNCRANQLLTYVNVANGNNVNFESDYQEYCFIANDNPKLKTIYIDKGFTPPTSPPYKAWRKDATATYVEFEKYPLLIAGIEVTSVNASNITGAGITGGKISYNHSTKTLTLDNATIYTSATAIMSRGDQLKILLKGVNNIESNSFNGIHFYDWIKGNSIYGTGVLNVKGDVRNNNGGSGIKIGKGGGLSITGGCVVNTQGAYVGIGGSSTSYADGLGIDNASVRAYGATASIGFINLMYVESASFLSPSGASFLQSAHAVVDRNKNVIKSQWVEIGTNYYISVAGTQVTSINASKITGPGISGTVSYDASSHTLTLNNATITLSGTTSSHGLESYLESRDNLKIKLVGTNKINHTGTDNIKRGTLLRKSTRFTGTGSLNVYRQGGEAFLIEENNTLTFEGGCTVSVESTSYCGIRGMSGSKLVVNNATLKAKGANYYSIGGGFSSLTMTGVEITSPAGAAFSSSLGGVALNGSLVKGQWVVIEKPTVTK